MLPQIVTDMVVEKKWRTKISFDRTMMPAFELLQLASQDKAMLNSEEINHVQCSYVHIAIIELCLSESISKLVMKRSPSIISYLIDYLFTQQIHVFCP